MPLANPHFTRRSLTISRSCTTSTKPPCVFCACSACCAYSAFFADFLVTFRWLYSSCQRVYPLAILAQNLLLPLPLLLPNLPNVTLTLMTLCAKPHVDDICDKSSDSQLQQQHQQHQLTMTTPTTFLACKQSTCADNNDITDIKPTLML